MAKENSSLKMIITLVIITALIALAMSYVNTLTAPIIEKNAQEKLDKSLSEVLPADEYTVLEESETHTVYEAKKAGERTGILVINSAKGYGGDIEVMTGILNDGSISKVEILSMSETPGLGANAGNDSFKEQFVGRSGKIGVNKTESTDKEIKALSGATITSKAVTDAVNDAITIAEQWRDK